MVVSNGRRCSNVKNIAGCLKLVSGWAHNPVSFDLVGSSPTPATNPSVLARAKCPAWDDMVKWCTGIISSITRLHRTKAQNRAGIGKVFSALLGFSGLIAKLVKAPDS